MDDSFSKLKLAFEEEKHALAKEREKLELERKEFQQDTKDISKISKIPLDNVLSLNIGGKKITIKRSTLTQVKGSLLETMFSSSHWEEKLDRDKEGNIFLDFDPKLFGKIIDYLRARLILEEGSPIPFPVVSREDEDNFKSLVAYLRLGEGILPKRPKDLFSTTDTLTIFGDGVGVEKPQNGDKHAWVKGKEVISKGEFTWRLKIEEFTHWMLIGVINVNEVMTQTSYSLPSVFGWGGNANEFYMGGKVSTPGWGHWQKGQEIELALDCTNRLLKLRIINGGTFTMNIQGNGPWQLHMNLYRPPTKVLLL